MWLKQYMTEELEPGSKHSTGEKEGGALELGILETAAKAGPGAYLSPSDIAAEIPNIKSPDTPAMLDRMLRLYNILTHSLLQFPDDKALYMVFTQKPNTLSTMKMMRLWLLIFSWHRTKSSKTYGVEHVGGDMFVSVPKADAIFMKPKQKERTEKEYKALAEEAGFHAFRIASFSLNTFMRLLSLRHVLMFAVIGALWNLQRSEGIRFVIDRDECFSHDVKYEGDTVHVSFVVIKADSPWHYGDEGVDLVVKGPSGEQIHDFRDKTSEKFDFVAHKSGVHKFCFTNKSPYHETVDFDVHVGHFSYFEQHAKDEHFAPLLEQIGKLEEALYNIQFEQHWLEAQTDRQAIVNDAMSRRAIHKAIFESAALIGASALQVYLLQRLFERKLGTSRV
ncbi:unnamed protein product [Sphenostylis stenocarpa]|uniref:GOLD domain-containing protein n=1 Tax=Sphenostylis stenocarpa TaxID=92480 RepID=A0AA86TD63_9FABA|nr:unnamed protein product [Sphenostylis stenocarpa]